MATYQQVLKSKAQGRRQLWYLYGPAPALVQDAYELAQAHVASTNLEVAKRVFFGGEAKAHEIEQELLRDLDQDRQMVVLLEAEKFKQWDQLLPVFAIMGVERFFIAVSSESAPEDVKKHFLNSTKSRYVSCKPLSVEDQRVWVESHLRISRDALTHLITKAQGDHAWLLNQIRKLKTTTGSSVTLQTVREICQGSGTPDFALSLLERNKQGTFQSIAKQSPTSKDLDTLISTLGKFLPIYDNASKGPTSPRLLLELTGLTQKEISVFRKSALYYDSQVSTRCYAALVKLYTGLSQGSQQAFFALVTRWG